MSKLLSVRTSRLMLAATVACTTLAAGTIALAPTSAGAAAPPPGKTTAHLFAINDFHGNIDPPSGSGGLVNGAPAGGVEYLATTLNNLREAADTPSLTVAAGDLIGGTPLVSAAFHDEPTIEEMNTLGLDVTSVGNHEFDEGVTELLRLNNGGCHPTDGCQDGDGFARSGLPVPRRQRGLQVERPADPAALLDPERRRQARRLHRHDPGGHAVDREPGRHPTVNFLDEAKTANKYAGMLAKARRQVRRAAHPRGRHPGTAADPERHQRVRQLHRRDQPDRGQPATRCSSVVVSGHTHRPYVCGLPNKSGDNSLVTSAGSFGTIVTDITVSSTGDGRMLSATAHNVIVENGIRNPDGTWPDDARRQLRAQPGTGRPDAKVIADKYRTAVAPIANRVVGQITADITARRRPAGESPLGDVIADGSLRYTHTGRRPDRADEPGRHQGRPERSRNSPAARRPAR